MHYSKFNNKKTEKYSEKRRGYMEEKKISISQVIAIGGAFMGFVIGSSFASGQEECMQYFTGHGVLGSIGAGIIALFCCMYGLLL